MPDLVISGGIRDREINCDQLQQLQKNPMYSPFRKFWDVLLDFFSRSNVSQAKSLCTKAFHSQDSSVRIQSFLELRALAHQHCQSQFTISPNSKPNTIDLNITSLNIRIEVPLNNQDAMSLMQQVKREMDTAKNTKTNKQFLGDIARWNYILELESGECIELSRKQHLQTTEHKFKQWQRLSVKEAEQSLVAFLGSQLFPQSIACWSIDPEQINRHVPNLTLVNTETAEQQCRVIDFGGGNVWVECYIHQHLSEEEQEQARIGNFCKELTLHCGFFVSPQMTTCGFFDYEGISFE